MKSERYGMAGSLQGVDGDALDVNYRDLDGRRHLLAAKSAVDDDRRNV
jgi:hypothetical protein